MAYIRSGNGGGSTEQTATGTFTLPNTNTTLKVTLGFKPKYLAVLGWNGGNSSDCWVYNEEFGTTSYPAYYRSSGTTGGATENLPNTNTNRLNSIDNDGFTVKGTTTSTYYNLTFRYFAIG